MRTVVRFLPLLILLSFTLPVVGHDIGVSRTELIEKPENMRDEGPIERGNEEFADRCYVCK